MLRRFLGILGVALLVSCSNGTSTSPALPTGAPAGHYPAALSLLAQLGKPPASTVTPHGVARTTQYGVDYGLHRQCVRTIAPNLPNFYYDKVDCPSSSYPKTHYWTTAVEIETAAGPGSCGTIDQSAPIDDGAQVSETWAGSRWSGYAVTTGIAYNPYANPCSPSTWTWVPLMDNWSGGGPLPNPSAFKYAFTEQYNYVAGSGSVRSIVGLGVQWPKNGVMQSILIEVNAYTQANWPPPLDTPPANGVIYYAASSNSYYVNVTGTSQPTPVVITPGQTAAVSVIWKPILLRLIALGLIPAPDTWAKAATTAAFVAHEVRDDAAQGAGGGPASTLRVSNIQETASGP